MFDKLVIVAFLAGEIAAAAGFKYDTVLSTEEIFNPCPEYPDNFIDKFLTLPENITGLPDDTFYVKGNIVFIHEFLPINYKAHYEFYRLVRGVWQETPYTVKRDDFCKSAFRTDEVWAPYLKNVPDDQRTCPLTKGKIISLDFQTEQGFNFPSPSMEGEYWARFQLGDKNNLNEFCCADYFFRLFRS